MDDKDHVFARFKDEKPDQADRRGTLNIPRRNGAGGSRTVEVVHLRSGGAIKDRPQRTDTHLRAASWDNGFQAKRGVAMNVPPAPDAPRAAAPTTHVMPAWEPAATEAGPTSPPRSGTAAQAPAVAQRPGRGRPPKEMSAAPSARRVADPFDADDAGANCMRCGYAIEPAREKRGLLTCSGCG